MRVPPVNYISGAILALAILSGCAGGDGPNNSNVPQQGGAASGEAVERLANLRFPSVLPPALQKPVRPSRVGVKNIVASSMDMAGGTGFVSDYFNSVVYIYNGKAASALTGFYGPQGLATDASGRLYVADSYDSRVQVYASPYDGPPATLRDPMQEPGDVAIDGSGNVAVTNIDTTSGGNGSVSFYAAGGTAPIKKLGSGGLKEMFFCAFDAKGNLFLDGLDFHDNFAVGEILGGINGTSITMLTTANSVLFPGGVQVARSGLISIADQGAQAIYTYRPPSGGSLGQPVVTTQLTGSADPAGFASIGSQIFVANAGLGALSEYALPHGGSPIRTVVLPDSGEPVGVAIASPES